MSIELERIVAALRDTAEKSLATETILVENFSAKMGAIYNGSREPPPETHVSDKFSREWIAGRLLGMADMIEALEKDR